MTHTNSRRPTMKDVAAHAQVSLSTVSYVLNETGPVAPARRRRVLDAMKLLEYMPNESARKLKRGGPSTIGMVVPDLTNPFFAMVTKGVEEAASSRDALVALVVPTAGKLPEEKQVELLRSQRVDGVIYLSGTGSIPAAIYDIARSGPVVLVDEQIPGSGLPAVVSAARKGAREVAAHVLAQGHRRIAVISGPSGLWTAQQRLAGYREAFAGAGLDPDSVPVLVGDYEHESGKKLAAQLLSSDSSPTALICANDLLAVGAMEYCREVGLRVPADVSITGIDDLPFSVFLTPRLTTVRQPAHEMGLKAASILFDLLDGREVEAISELPQTLQLRESVCPPWDAA